MKTLFKPLSALAVGLSVLVSASGFAAKDYISNKPLSESCTNELQEYQQPIKLVLVVGEDGAYTIFPPFNRKLEPLKFPLQNQYVLEAPDAIIRFKYQVNPNLSGWCFTDASGHRWCF